ncbi:MAG: hypothetical protein AAF311_16750, partial [Pseudomonadota bacterium]
MNLDTPSGRAEIAALLGNDPTSMGFARSVPRPSPVEQREMDSDRHRSLASERIACIREQEGAVAARNFLLANARDHL